MIITCVVCIFHNLWWWCVELSISLVFGAAVACAACAAFLIASYFSRSNEPVEVQHDREKEAAQPTPPVIERIPDATPRQIEPAPTKTSIPTRSEWKPIETARPGNSAAPIATIPKCVAVLDVETTGLHERDRIITLAGVKLLDTDLLTDGKASLEYLHLIFDPGRKSHPRAEAVHGYSDWVLRHQDAFGTFADTIASFFNSADLVVAHNAKFDFGFYNREMERAARSPIHKPVFCTMDTYRQRGFAGSCSLDAVCRRIGVARSGNLHGALEDAWLAMRVYLWLNARNVSGELPMEFRGGPSNFKAAPPLPDGPLPRRRGRKVNAVSMSTPSRSINLIEGGETA